MTFYDILTRLSKNVKKSRFGFLKKRTIRILRQWTVNFILKLLLNIW